MIGSAFRANGQERGQAGEIGSFGHPGRQSRRPKPGDRDPRLRELLALNPTLKIFLSHGRSDLVTPYMVSRYVLDHLPTKLVDRTHLKVYKGGHMFYTDLKARAAFTSDANAFYTGAGPDGDDACRRDRDDLSAGTHAGTLDGLL